MGERRQHARLRLPLTGEWRPFQVYDISPKGCYVETVEHDFAPGAKVELELRMPDDTSLLVKGDVVRVDAKIGFAVEFISLTPQQRGRFANH